MALKDITIQFSAKGDDVLIKTIKALDTATKSLIKAQVSLANEGKKQVISQKKKIGVDKANLNSIRKLNLELKLHGRSLKSVKINTDLYKQALKGNRLAMGKIRLATVKYTASLKKMNVGMFSSATSGRLLSNTFATLRSKLLITSFAIMLVERTVVSLVKTFAAQEAVNQKLRAGLANVAGTTEGVTQRLIDYSSALQKTTAFGDELITNGMAQLTTFGLNEEAIKALTPQVLNVARAIQTTSGTMPDLNSLFIAFGKATTTGIGALTRYGIELTESERAQLTVMDANTRAIAINKILDRQYGGLAEAYAKTTAGMLESAKAARGDAAEAFGEVLAPAVLAVSGALKKMAEAMTPETIKAYGTGFGLAGIGAGLFLIKLKGIKTTLISLQAMAVRNWVVALIAVLGIGAGIALDYFNVYKDGNDTLTDAEKNTKGLEKAIRDKGEALGWSESRIVLEINAMRQRKAIELELIEAQEDGAVSLREQLKLLNTKNEVEKMLINLGHRSSIQEDILIIQIVKKQQAIEYEKIAREESIKTYKKYLEVLRDEINLRLKMSQKIELAQLDLLASKYEGMKIEGKLTESNSKKLLAYIAFNQELISTFNKRVSITKDLTQAVLDNGISLDSQDIAINNLNETEKAYLEILISIFNQKQKNMALDVEGLSSKSDELEMLNAIKDSTEAIYGKNLTFLMERIDLQKRMFEQQGFNDIAITAWAEQAKTDIVIEHLEKRSAKYNAFMAGYDTFVNSLTDMEMTGKERSEKIWESTKAGFTKFLGEMLKDKIKQIMAERIINDTARAAEMATVAMEARALATLWSGAAFAATLASGATNVPTAIAAIIAGKIAATTAFVGAEKGFDGVVNKPTLFLTGEGNKPEHVRVTPIGRPEERALTDGGITINISAPLIDETIIESIIPAIQKAQRMNLA